MNNFDELATTEAERLRSLLFDCGVSENYIALLDDVIVNTAYMKIKLDDTRAKINNTSVVIPYDNGGGQTGIRENPLFKGYESLFKSYMSGLSKILDALPQSAEIVRKEETEKPQTILELVKAKKKA